MSKVVDTKEVGIELSSGPGERPKVDANELGVVSSDAQARPSFEATKLLSGSKAANAEEQFIAGTAPKHPSEIRIIVPKELPKDEKTGKPVEINGDKEWHLLPYENLMEELHSRFDVAKNAGGLNSDEVERLQKIWGKNAITPPKTVPWWVKFLWNLISGFQLMLWAGAAMCFVVVGITANTPAGPDYQSLALAIVLILVVVVTTSFQSLQEGKADQVMEALKKLAPSKVFCFRDGDLKEIDAVELVPGDIVKVNGGEKVPADIRVLASSDLKVNNASLTGENIDIKLGSEANHKELYEAKNVARSGCNFTRGNGVGIVFATGDNTFFGAIAAATTQIERPETTMKHEIHRFIKIMSVIALSLGLIFLILALVYGYSAIDALVFMIGIVVANVPEGLLPQLTVALSLTAQRMLSKGVLVNNLEIIETLGAVDVICSDKTGTLTCNRMSVSHVVYNATIHVIPGLTPIMQGDTFANFDKEDAHFKKVQRIATLNTDAIFLASSDKEPDVLKKETKGDASESAIIKFVHPIRDIVEYRAACKRECSIPFNSSNKWMLAIHEDEKTAEEPDVNAKPLILMMKGAPERILNMCSFSLENGELVPLTEEVRAKHEKINVELASRGERVLAFAQLELNREQFPPGFVFDAEANPPNFPTTGLTLVGFLALIDPPRMSVKPAIQECYDAGIKVFMVTGDHPITAHAIAKSLNLVTAPTKAELEAKGQTVPSTYNEAIVIHGTEMLSFTDADWTRVLKHKQIVFARTMPQQKQDIVRELNKLKNIVAMTGDGVNDAPALKAANVGIAMGSGAAVAKEAGQIILLNDDFGAIVDGIREGRLIFENLKKCICYVLSSNIPELIPFLLFIAMKIPLGIETIVILLIDLGTDLAPAISLAYEEPEDKIMRVPPREEHAHLVGLQLMCIAYGTIGIFETAIAFMGFYWQFSLDGFSMSDTVGQGLSFRVPLSELSKSDPTTYKNFELWCRTNKDFVAMKPETESLEEWCREPFYKYRLATLAKAQAAFLLAVVWCQIGNIFIRKTQVATIFEFRAPDASKGEKWYQWHSRIWDNHVLLWSLVFEIVLIIILVYVPGLNALFMMSAPAPTAAACTLWAIPTFIVYDEIRKFLCRLWPQGILDKCTNF